MVSSISSWIDQNQGLAAFLLFVGMLGVSRIVYFITKNYVIKQLSRLTSRSKTDIDDVILEKVISKRFAYIAPILIMYVFFEWLHQSWKIAPVFLAYLQQIILALIVLIVLVSISAFLGVMNDVLKRFSAFKDKPVKGYIQVVQLIIYIFGGVFILALLTKTSPLAVMGGLGAMTAVLILVFRDTILSFVASIQIASNDLVKVGDWIEMRKYGADGNVIDIALHTVKVQNWDKTIVVIPTHRLIEDSFINWRGMQQSGGRRIKRAIYIDISSIRFCNKAILDKFRKMALIKDYINSKEAEILQTTQPLEEGDEMPFNRRRLTNIGVFRMYVEAYLRNNPRISSQLTFLVRQLPSGSTGLPLEIYVFANDVVWANYEAIQADIFDHILAIVPEFGLRVFQNPTGYDLEKLGEPSL